ncbi:hypothetical protein D1164_02175 [Mariniphaga sediminis]|uniref:Uncharacterized protein n=1 Tax=Mariniphaga sediminis TaxID=1628158 RepID=A0A399DAX3_9BACT|nr:hypothetical protein D1164_02175 [Mariniphaga sediminis]
MSHFILLLSRKRKKTDFNLFLPVFLYQPVLQTRVQYLTYITKHIDISVYFKPWIFQLFTLAKVN